MKAIKLRRAFVHHYENFIASPGFEISCSLRYKHRQNCVHLASTHTNTHTLIIRGYIRHKASLPIIVLLLTLKSHGPIALA